MCMVLVAVRTGKGTVTGRQMTLDEQRQAIRKLPHNQNLEFSDTVEYVWRTPRRHVGWQSVIYRNRRFRLGGGIRNCHFICLNNPVKGRR